MLSAPLVSLMSGMFASDRFTLINMKTSVHSICEWVCYFSDVWARFVHPVDVIAERLWTLAFNRNNNSKWGDVPWLKWRVLVTRPASRLMSWIVAVFTVVTSANSKRKSRIRVCNRLQLNKCIENLINELGFSLQIVSIKPIKNTFLWFIAI